jgi:hypothetical protein
VDLRAVIKGMGKNHREQNMCEKTSIPNCFGNMYSKTHEDCQGSTRMEPCLLRGQCAKAQYHSESLVEIHKEASALLTCREQARIGQ